jgi:hypothetical protein
MKAQYWPRPKPVRDPKRIKAVLAAVRDAWLSSPDLRLGQLLVNATGAGKDVFYIEDEELASRLKLGNHNIF